MRPRWGDEQGYLEGLFPVFLFTVLLLMGFVYDGGMMLHTKREALNVSGVAARAAAMQLDVDFYRDPANEGQVRVEQEEANAQIASYVGSYSGVSLTGVVWEEDRVIVSVAAQWQPRLLHLVGISGQTITGDATAELIPGTDS